MMECQRVSHGRSENASERSWLGPIYRLKTASDVSLACDRKFLEVQIASKGVSALFPFWLVPTGYLKNLMFFSHKHP